MSMPIRRASLALALLLFAPILRTEAAVFTPLGQLSGGTSGSEARAVSGDGSTVVGSSDSAEATSGAEAIRWTSADGMQGLGFLPIDEDYSRARGVSGDGAVVVGEGRTVTVSDPSSSHFEAWRWTESDGMVGLGVLPGGQRPISNANDASRDGSIVVGTSSADTPGFWQAFVWSSSDGMTGLPFLPDPPQPTRAMRESSANAVSADGSVIVGHSHGRPVKWVDGVGELLTDDPVGPLSAIGSALDVSADGSVIVGSLHSLPQRWFGDQADDLGTPPGSIGSALAVSGDGSVIVGNVTLDWQGTPDSFSFVWDEAHGLRRLTDVLTAHGADLTGWTELSATDVSDDGNTIVGSATNPDGVEEAWVAVLPDRSRSGRCDDGIDNDGDGFADLDDPGCPFPEASPENPPCDDGIDNDADGFVDFEDSWCSNHWPYWETSPCGLGIELVLALPLLLRLRARHGRPR